MRLMVARMQSGKAHPGLHPGYGLKRGVAQPHPQWLLGLEVA